MKNSDFKKANIVNVIKYKIKWLLKTIWVCINKPFDILMEWM